MSRPVWRLDHRARHLPAPWPLITELAAALIVVVWVTLFAFAPGCRTDGRARSSDGGTNAPSPPHSSLSSGPPTHLQAWRTCRSRESGRRP